MAVFMLTPLLLAVGLLLWLVCRRGSWARALQALLAVVLAAGAALLLLWPDHIPASRTVLIVDDDPDSPRVQAAVEKALGRLREEGLVGYDLIRIALSTAGEADLAVRPWASPE